MPYCTLCLKKEVKVFHFQNNIAEQQKLVIIIVLDINTAHLQCMCMHVVLIQFHASFFVQRSSQSGADMAFTVITLVSLIALVCYSSAWGNHDESQFVKASFN